MAEQDADEIIEALEFLEGDERYDYIIGLGKALPPMPDALKTPATRVEGCMSQVWLVSRVDNSGREPVLEFQGDSDAIIVKGLVAIVIALCSGRTPREVLDLDLADLFERVEMHKHLSGGRRSGLAAMVARIKGLAEAYTTAEPVN
ncbi:SufE family protein [Inquilinus sp. CAU 1745]|uniref:SufE family protein n=1 Tax=Inquilinus sp. CAU 1745 TaxID=3140369 RepID=UPI00325A5BF4